MQRLHSTLRTSGGSTLPERFPEVSRVTQMAVESALHSKAFRPKQRLVKSEIVTPVGWTHGTFLVPECQSLADFVNRGSSILKVLNVKLPLERSAVPFLALQRAAVTLIAPQEDDRIETDPCHGPLIAHDVVCVMENATLDGRLDIPMNMRLSDYLRLHEEFVVLRDAVWNPLIPSRQSGPRRFVGVALANVSRMIGIAEREPH